MLTPSQIDACRTLIAATPTLQALATAGNDSALAEALTASLPPVPKPGVFLGERGIYALLGVDAGETFLKTIESMAAIDNPYQDSFKRVERWVKDGTGIDVGIPVTQQMLISLKKANAGEFDDSTIDVVVAHGSQPQTVTTDDVAVICSPLRPDGKAGE